MTFRNKIEEYRETLRTMKSVQVHTPEFKSAVKKARTLRGQLDQLQKALR